jgi:hypothetical protein
MHQAIGRQKTTALPEIMAAWEVQSSGKLAAIPANVLVEIQFLQARICFQNQQYGQALVKVNRLINESAETVPRYWLALCYVLRLLIHQALGNFDYLDYELRSVRGKLKKQLHDPQLAQALLEVVEVMRKLVKQKSPALPAIGRQQNSHFGKQLLRLLPLAPSTEK